MNYILAVGWKSFRHTVNVTANAYLAACNEIGEDTKIDELDIISEINKHYKILKDAELKKSTDNFENYYKKINAY